MTGERDVTLLLYVSYFVALICIHARPISSLWSPRRRGLPFKNFNLGTFYEPPCGAFYASKNPHCRYLLLSYPARGGVPPLLLTYGEGSPAIIVVICKTCVLHPITIVIMISNFAVVKIIV